jgi:hypothetical protein
LTFRLCKWFSLADAWSVWKKINDFHNRLDTSGWFGRLRKRVLAAQIVFLVVITTLHHSLLSTFLITVSNSKNFLYFGTLLIFWDRGCVAFLVSFPTFDHPSYYKIYKKNKK